MDWPTLDLDLSESNFGYFRYGQGKCTILRKLVTDEVSCDQLSKIRGCRTTHTTQVPHSWDLHSETQWDSWLEKVS
jgi:hypothetical protein